MFRNLVNFADVKNHYKPKQNFVTFSFLLLSDLWGDNGIEDIEGNSYMPRMKTIPCNVAIVRRLQEADRGW